jgi:hypothetical protein
MAQKPDGNRRITDLLITDYFEPPHFALLCVSAVALRKLLAIVIS